MRAAMIENGVVINVIEVEDINILPGLVQSETASIGDLWDGLQFTNPSGPPPVETPPPEVNAQPQP